MAEHEYLEIMDRLDKMEQLIIGMKEKLDRGNLPIRDRLDHKEAAAWLGISSSHLYNLVSAGKIPVCKSGDGKNCLNNYLIEDLEKWARKYKRFSEDEISSMASTYCAKKPRQRHKERIES